MALFLDKSAGERNCQGVPNPSVTEEIGSCYNLIPSVTKTKGRDQGCLLRGAPKAVSSQAHTDSQINFLGMVPQEHALSSRAQKCACSGRSPQATPGVATLQSAYEDLLKAHGISSK